MKTTDVSTKDYKYILSTPDESFSPERNQAIINETISETTKFFEELNKEFNENIAERTDILSSYAGYRFGQGTKSFKDYAGKKLHSRLIGEKLLAKVKVMESVNRLNGNTGKFADTVLI